MKKKILKEIARRIRLAQRNKLKAGLWELSKARNAAIKSYEDEIQIYMEMRRFISKLK